MANDDARLTAIYGSERDPASFFSACHFSTGVLAGVVGIPFAAWTFAAVGYEVYENWDYAGSQEAPCGTKARPGSWKAEPGTTAGLLGFGWPTYRGDSALGAATDVLCDLLGWYAGRAVWDAATAARDAGSTLARDTFGVALCVLLGVLLLVLALAAVIRRQGGSILTASGVLIVATLGACSLSTMWRLKAF